MLKKVLLLSTIIATCFASLSVAAAAEVSCLQVVQSPELGEEKICYTSTGQSKSELEQQCKDKNQMLAADIKMTGELVDQCPADQIGACQINSPVGTLTISHYDLAQAEKVSKSCESIGGEWKLVK